MRLTGVKELAFLGYLATPFSDHYFEVGYGVENILRILRVEAAASFQNGVYQGFGVRVGVATSITGDGDAFNFGIEPFLAIGSAFLLEDGVTIQISTTDRAAEDTTYTIILNE